VLKRLWRSPCSEPGMAAIYAASCRCVVTGAVLCALTGCTSPPGSPAPQVPNAMQEALGTAPPGLAPDVWKDVRALYERRGEERLWTRDPVMAQAAAAVDVLQQAPEHGLSTADYLDDDLARALTPEVPPTADAPGHGIQELARLDVRVTSALLALGHDVALGRTKPEAVDPRWKARRTPPDFVGTLSEAVRSEELGTWLNAVRPVHPEYAALQKALSTLWAQQGKRAGDRARRLAINLERWRWMPNDLGERHILVNVPAFHLIVREQRRPVLDMRVVVGKDGRETPIFSSRMATIVFSPYWNVPDSIAEGEIIPAAASDPDYLFRNEFEVFRPGKRGNAVIDGDSVNWSDPKGVKPLVFRQKPGPVNALGHVKFLFPNPYDVYLHDTPSAGLFASEGRAFSHGCVRVEHPVELAKYLLRNRPEWTDEKIAAAMDRETEQPVPLTERLPVHIFYFTAWPRANGGVDTWPDVYGYDARQAAVAEARQAPSRNAAAKPAAAVKKPPAAGKTAAARKPVPPTKSATAKKPAAKQPAAKQPAKK